MSLVGKSLELRLCGLVVPRRACSSLRLSRLMPASCPVMLTAPPLPLKALAVMSLLSLADAAIRLALRVMSPPLPLA